MAQHLLSARRVTALLSGGKPRRHGDGGCLYLQVNGPDRGAWVFMTKRGGKQRPIGLGSARDVSLKDARDVAEACRRAVSLGRNPKSVLAEAAGELTFDTAARIGRLTVQSERPKAAVLIRQIVSAGMDLTCGCNAVLDRLGFAVLVLAPIHPGGHDTDRDQGLVGQWLGLVHDESTVVIFDHLPADELAPAVLSNSEAVVALRR
jgi:hypothetical protein